MNKMGGINIINNYYQLYCVPSRVFSLMYQSGLIRIVKEFGVSKNEQPSADP